MEAERQKINSLRIAIVGTRGIPNEYGGFEQFAEYLGCALVEKGHKVTVYNSSEHSYKEKSYKGVQIIYKYCPEKALGSSAHFLYDWLCIRDCSKKKFDIIYNAGYSSSAPAIFMYSKKSKAVWITNMDGIEWKRDKWSPMVKQLIKKTEHIAVKYSDFIISDNVGIKEYYKEKFNVDSYFLPYGAEVPDSVSKKPLTKFSLTPNQYYILVARLEPENSIETIIDGYCKSKTKKPLVIVGGYKSKYGRYLKDKYLYNQQILFLGGIYEKDTLNCLRKYANLYFHGHTVGGTNPSLLEAMAVGVRIAAHKNSFNESVLGSNSDYFSNSEDIKEILLSNEKIINSSNKLIKKNISTIINKYSWPKIISDYETLFVNLYNEFRLNQLK